MFRFFSFSHDVCSPLWMLSLSRMCMYGRRDHWLQDSEYSPCVLRLDQPWTFLYIYCLWSCLRCRMLLRAPSPPPGLMALYYRLFWLWLLFLHPCSSNNYNGTARDDTWTLLKSYSCQFVDQCKYHEKCKIHEASHLTFRLTRINEIFYNLQARQNQAITPNNNKIIRIATLLL